MSRAGPCVADGPAWTLSDWSAPDGPAVSIPLAGVGAMSLAREGGGGSSLGIWGRGGLFAGGWLLVKVNRAEISLSAWRG